VACNVQARRDSLVKLHSKKELGETTLLVLTDIQNAKARATVKMVLKCRPQSHRGRRRRTSQCLLSNGLDPTCCSASLRRSTHRRHLPSSASEIRSCGKICLITRLSEQGLRREAAELGIKRTLSMPVTREDVESVIESLTPPRRKSVRLATCPRCEILQSRRAVLRIQRIFQTTCLPTICGRTRRSNFFLAASRGCSNPSPGQVACRHRCQCLDLGEAAPARSHRTLIHKNSRRSGRDF